MRTEISEAGSALVGSIKEKMSQDQQTCLAENCVKKLQYLGKINLYGSCETLAVDQYVRSILMLKKNSISSSCISSRLLKVKYIRDPRSDFNAIPKQNMKRMKCLPKCKKRSINLWSKRNHIMSLQCTDQY